MKKYVIIVLSLCFILTGCQNVKDFISNKTPDSITEYIDEAISSYQEERNESSTYSTSTDNSSSQQATSKEQDELLKKREDANNKLLKKGAYNYSRLSTSQKSIYQDFYIGVSEYQEQFSVYTTDETLLYSIMTQVTDDCPEIFYITSYSYIIYSDSIKVSPKYSYTKAQSDSYLNSLQECVQQIKKATSSMTDDMDIMKYVYDYVILNVTYQTNTQKDQTVIGSLIEGKAVCAGYARAYQYILNELGYFCHYIRGNALDISGVANATSSHGWNMVKYKGSYYYVDATWGDNPSKSDGILTSFFMMSSTDMLTYYTPSDHYETTTGERAPYYSRSYSYFIEYNESTVNALVEYAIRNEQTTLVLKASDKSVFTTMLNDLTHRGLLSQVLKTYGKSISSNSYYESLNYMEISIK